MLIIYTLTLALSTSQVPAPSGVARSDVDGKGSAAGESIEEIVEKWIVASKESGPFQGSFRVFEYDHTFSTITRGVGRFYIESPRKWRVDFEPDPLVSSLEKQVAHRISYALHQRKHRTLKRNDRLFYDTEFTDDNFYHFEGIITDDHLSIEEANTISKFHSIHAKLWQCLLLPHTTESPHEHFNIHLGDLDALGLHLVFTPQKSMKGGFPGYPKIELLLDEETFHPMAVKFHHSGGNSDTVYTFSRRETHVDILDDLYEMKDGEIAVTLK